MHGLDDIISPFHSAAHRLRTILHWQLGNAGITSLDKGGSAAFGPSSGITVQLAAVAAAVAGEVSSH